MLITAIGGTIVLAAVGSGVLLIAYVAMSLGDAIGFNGMLFNGG
jgi:hypothetical protein